jgi:hypothetical protein
MFVMMRPEALRPRRSRVYSIETEANETLKSI